MGQFSEELQEMDMLFQAAPEPDAPIEDGTYTAVILNPSIIRSKNDPSLLFFKLELGIEGGTADGQTVDVIQALNPAEQKRVLYLKRFLRTLGYDESTLSGLEEWMSTLIGHYYEIVVKTNGQYQNIYINRRVEPKASAHEELPEHLPDDMPF